MDASEHSALYFAQQKQQRLEARDDALLALLKRYEPEQRRGACERALAAIADEEHRGELRKSFDQLSTDEQARRLA